MTLGVHTLTVSATEKLGNRSSITVTFTIIATAPRIKVDVTTLAADGKIKMPETENSVLAKLDAADNARSKGMCNTAANQYNAFINEVKAQSGSGIDAGAATILIADAQYLIAHCP